MENTPLKQIERVTDTYQVYRHQGRWKVKKKNAIRSSSQHFSREDAVQMAHAFAKHYGAKVEILSEGELPLTLRD